MADDLVTRLSDDIGAENADTRAAEIERLLVEALDPSVASVLKLKVTPYTALRYSAIQILASYLEDGLQQFERRTLGNDGPR